MNASLGAPLEGEKRASLDGRGRGGDRTRCSGGHSTPDQSLNNTGAIERAIGRVGTRVSPREWSAHFPPSLQREWIDLFAGLCHKKGMASPPELSLVVRGRTLLFCRDPVSRALDAPGLGKVGGGR